MLRPLWLWVFMVSLVVFKVMDEIQDEGWEQINLWGRRGLLSLAFISFSIWLFQNVLSA